MRLAGELQLQKHLLGGEKVVVAVRRHWITIWKEVGLAIVTLVMLIFISLGATAQTAGLSDALWWLWFLVFARALYSVFAWRNEWFIATDQRLMLITGIFKRRVATLPNARVTDMAFDRDILGKIFGYGGYVLESAGDVQAMREVNYIPQPDAVYRAILAQVFKGAGGDAGVTPVIDDPEALGLHAPFDEDDGNAMDYEDVPTAPMPQPTAAPESRRGGSWDPRRLIRREPPPSSAGPMLTGHGNRGPVLEESKPTPFTHGPPEPHQRRRMRDLISEGRGADRQRTSETLYQSADLDTSFSDGHGDPTRM